MEVVVYCGEAQENENVIESGASIDCGEMKFDGFESVGSNIRAVLSNTTKKDVTGDIHIGVYNRYTGAMVELKSENVIIKAKNKAYSPEIAVPDNCSVKVFLWESAKMLPLLNFFGE